MAQPHADANRMRDDIEELRTLSAQMREAKNLDIRFIQLDMNNYLVNSLTGGLPCFIKFRLHDIQRVPLDDVPCCELVATKRSIRNRNENRNCWRRPHRHGSRRSAAPVHGARPAHLRVNADLKLTHFWRDRRSKFDPPGPLWPHANIWSCDPSITPTSLS